MLALPKNSVRLGGVTERADGVWAGVGLGLDAGRFLVTASGTRGQLTPTGAGVAPTRDVGQLAVSARYEVRSWLGLDLGYDARAFSSAAGYQRWNIAVLGATASRDLGISAVRGFASLAYLPVLSVTNQQRPTFGLGSDVGLSLAPNRFPLSFLLSYRIQRFSFPAAAARSEQFEALTFSVGVRARRRPGGWTLRGS